MEAYLLENGADEAHLLKEEQSFSTVENLAYSKILIEKQEKLLAENQAGVFGAPGAGMPGAAGEPAAGMQNPVKPGNPAPAANRQIRVGIITSNFHLCRARLIAKKQDYDAVYGIASEADRVLLVHFSLRDGIALLKDRLMGNL